MTRRLVVAQAPFAFSILIDGQLVGSYPNPKSQTEMEEMVGAFQTMTGMDFDVVHVHVPTLDRDSIELTEQFNRMVSDIRVLQSEYGATATLL